MMDYDLVVIFLFMSTPKFLLMRVGILEALLQKISPIFSFTVIPTLERECIELETNLAATKPF